MCTAAFNGSFTSWFSLVQCVLAGDMSQTELSRVTFTLRCMYTAYCIRMLLAFTSMQPC